MTEPHTYDKIGPWLSKYQPPAAPEIVTITQDMAGDWLDYRIPDRQRKPSRVIIARYTEEMNAGRWRLTPEGLILDTDGYLFDGQHRLQAFRNSTLEELDFWVFPDQSSDLFSVVNVGYTRQARQLFNGPYATTVTSAVRYLGATPGKYIDTLSVSATLEALTEWPELVTHASGVSSVYQRVRIPASPHLAVLAQAERTEHRDKIPEWLAGLSYGAGLATGDARLHLRERFRGVKGRQRRDLGYNLIAKSWNLYVKGDRKQVLTWSEPEGIIQVTGTVPILETPKE